MNELYQLDPSLREVKDLEKVVLKVMAAKPAVEIDAQFVARLRRELAAKSSPKSAAIGWPYLTMYALAGAMAVLAVMFGVYQRGLVTPGTSQQKTPVCGERSW